MNSSQSAPNASTPLEGEAALVRAVGGVALTAAIINIIVGAGIFMLPALLMTRMGPSAPIAFFAGALAIIPIALCCAAIGSRAGATGGPYTYVAAAFGPFPGFIAGALMWICNAASSGGVAAALTSQVAKAFPIVAESGPRALLLVGIYTVLIALNAFGVKLGARAISVLATLKLTPLFLLVAVGLFFVDWNQISWFDVPSLGMLGTSMVLVMFAYSGMETALIPSGELRDSAHSVPRATMAGILLVVLLYVGIQVVCQGLLGPKLAGSSAPIAEAAGTLWSPGFVALLITAAVSMAGFLMGNLLACSRLLYALARDGFLPRVLARVTATHRVPLLAIICHGVVGCALAIAGNFEALALISGGANCLIYLAVSIAAWQAQRKGLRGRGEPFVLPAGALIPLLASLAMIAILATLTAAEWGAIAIALAALVALYGALHVLRKRQAA